MIGSPAWGQPWWTWAVIRSVTVVRVVWSMVGAMASMMVDVVVGADT